MTERRSHNGVRGDAALAVLEVEEPVAAADSIRQAHPALAALLDFHNNPEPSQ